MSLLGPDGRPLPKVEGRPMKVKAWMEAYESADRRDFRGYFYFPTLKPEEQLNSLTLDAIRERSEFLYNNVPPVRMAIDGLALFEVGTGLWPKWTSGAEEFDKAMTDAFHFANHDPRVFSSDASSDCYTMQYNIRRLIRKHGDCFGQLLRPAPGAIHPQMHLIPGYRVGNSGKDSEGWVNGVRSNRLGRPVAYRVLGAKSGEFEDVAAEDMLHFYDPMLPGQKRGEPALACVAKKLFRREDIAKAIANGTLARERLGFAIEQKSDPSGMGNRHVDLSGESEETVEENDDGSEYNLQKFFGEDEVNRIQIPKLPPDVTIKTLESNRPGTQVLEYQDTILRELAWSTLYPPEFVFFVSGMGNGTVARFVLQRVVAIAKAKRAQQMVPQFCNRWWVFDAWQLIKSGLFERLGVSVPRNWWQTKVMADADISVDVGREGALYDRRVGGNRMSIESYHAMAGEDAADVEDENLKAIERRMKKLKELNQRNGSELTYQDVWPRETSFTPLKDEPATSDE